MQELTLFYLESCPHCRRAFGYMDELCSEDERFAQIPVKKIEERQEKALADSYDYFYVPCYYIGDEKISEGSVNKEDVRAVFNKVLDRG